MLKKPNNKFLKSDEQKNRIIFSCNKNKFYLWIKSDDMCGGFWEKKLTCKTLVKHYRGYNYNYNMAVKSRQMFQGTQDTKASNLMPSVIRMDRAFPGERLN